MTPLRPAAPRAAALRAGPAPGRRCEAVVDLGAVGANVAALRRVTPAEVMAVVKANGYGHGMLPVARAALAAGASWLGVAFLAEALALRAAGVTAPVLCWLLGPGEPLLADAVRAGVDLSASAGWTLSELAGAARQTGRPARVHLEADTGMSRGGATAADWPGLVTAAARAAAAGEVEVVGVWTHLANADDPAHPGNDRQLAAFRDALATVARAGLRPQLRHAACSAALLDLPASHLDLVRPGLAVYGLTAPARRPGLVPAMTLRSRVAETEGGRTVGTVPAGYRDGVPSPPPGRGVVLVGGRRRPVCGRVGPGSFTVRAPDLRTGDEVVVFGPGHQGEPTVREWADALGTLPNEIVTRVGQQVPRRYVGGPAQDPDRPGAPAPLRWTS